MAIKINVTKQDQEALNHALELAGYGRQRRKFHCTIGFIEKMIPPEEVNSFGDRITRELQEVITREPLLYEVEKASHLFKSVLVLEPTLLTQVHLRKLNQWLFQRVNEISEARWGLNKESIPEGYTPHLTVWHTRHPDRRFKKLGEFAATHPKYHLGEAAFVIFS